MTIALRPRTSAVADLRRHSDLEQRVTELETRIAILERAHVEHTENKAGSFNLPSRATTVGGKERCPTDRALVAAIANSVGAGILFSARELVAHAAVDSELRQALGDVTPKRLGKRLRRLCGCGLERVGQDRDGAIWMVRVRDDSHSPSCGARAFGRE